MSKGLILNKLIQVLDRLLAPGAEISDTNVNRLVKCVTGMPEDLVDRSTLYGVLQLWFCRAVDIWENNQPHPAVLTLALNFAVFLSSEEDSFIELNEHNAIERFIKILKTALQNIGATPDVGYVRLMSCFLKHNSGCKWMLSTNYWSEILCLTVHSEQSAFVEKEKTGFICELVSKSLDISVDFPSRIVYYLFLPTIDFSETVKKQNAIDDNLFNSNCLPKLIILENIIETILDAKDEKYKEKAFVIFKLLGTTSEKYAFEEHAVNICLNSSNDEINYRLIKILYVLRFLEFVCDTKGVTIIKYEVLLPYLDKVEAVRRKLLSNYQKLFPKIIFIWARMIHKSRLLVPKVKLPYGNVIDLEDTLVCLQIVPCFSVTCYFSGEVQYEFEGDDLRDNYITERFRSMPPAALYQIFQIRDYMVDQFSFDFPITGIEYILKSLKYYTRNQAKNILTCLIYSLEDFTEIMKRNTEYILNTAAAMEYMGCLLNAIKELINDFNLKWPDTFETITLMEIALSIISTTGLSSEVIVKGLELISVAFSKHLSAGLTFLMDQLDGDLIEKIIEMCTEKLMEEESEIRSKSIKVIESISNIVNKDFSAFQSLILKHNLPFKIFEFAINDQQPNVRVAAVKCLQEMTRVDEFWNSITSRCNIYDNLCQIIYEDCDDIVRSEVSTLIAIIYEIHDISTSVYMNFCDTINHIITDDTSPTTRKNSLQFWRNVIHQWLTIEGMIDGEFPEVTFSKESKKIVILNDQEVKKRLIKVMHILCDNGCLFALHTALQDCDIEVNKTVKDIAIKLYDLLKNYNVQSSDFENSRESISEDSCSSESSKSDITGNPKCRQILRPDIFLEFLEEYLRPRSISPMISQYIIESTLDEILYGPHCENYNCSDSIIADFL